MNFQVVVAEHFAALILDRCRFFWGSHHWLYLLLLQDGTSIPAMAGGIAVSPGRVSTASQAGSMHASHVWFHCYSFSYSRSDGSSPRRPSISSAVTSSDTTEPYFDFSRGFPEVGSVCDFFFSIFPQGIIPVSWWFWFWLFALNKNLVINKYLSGMCD